MISAIMTKNEMRKEQSMSHSISAQAASHGGKPPLELRATSVDELAALAISMSGDEKKALLCRVLQMLSGDRLEQEVMLANTDGFVYAHIISPGMREYFRRIEHGGVNQITDSVDEPTFPFDQVRQELGLHH